VEPTCWCRYPIALQDPILDTNPRHLRDIQKILIYRRHSESTLEYRTNIQHPDSRGIKDLVKSYPAYVVNGDPSLSRPPMSPSRAVLRINPTVLAITHKPEGSTCWISGSVCHFPWFRTANEMRILSNTRGDPLAGNATSVNVIVISLEIARRLWDDSLMLDHFMRSIHHLC
jgi:hypothetical protein